MLRRRDGTALATVEDVPSPMSEAVPPSASEPSMQAAQPDPVFSQRRDDLAQRLEAARIDGRDGFRVEHEHANRGR
jgi:hypothetical protein